MGDPVSDLYGSRFSMDSVQGWSERIAGRSRGLFRPASLRSLLSTGVRLRSQSTASSSPSPDTSDNLSSVGSVESVFDSVFKKGYDEAVVYIVLVEAKGLPDAPSDGTAHGIYCKFQLGAEYIKSKTVPTTRHPKWKQRLKVPFRGNHLLQVSLWDKGKQKNFMGSCVLDLSPLEKERTHTLWKDLEDGFGSLHFSVTIFCNAFNQNVSPACCEAIQGKYAWHNFSGDFSIVGELKVKVHAAKGLLSRASAYCVLELDNERLQTHSTIVTTEPVWEKIFSFNIYNISSSLDVRLHDKSSSMNILSESLLGSVSIPLLRIRGREKRWFALKDRTKRNAAKGNCPRVLLELSIAWNPVKAAVRMFRPKDVKHIPEQKKADIGQMYSELEFVKDALEFVRNLNEIFKRLFEWDSREQSQLALFGWLLFWCYIELWMFPLLLVIPFVYFGFVKTLGNLGVSQGMFEETQPKDDFQNVKQDQSKTLTGRMYELPDFLGSITSSIGYITVTAERLANLATFKTPFVSFVAIAFLVVSSAVLRVLSFNYIMMALGIYKYTRKHLLNPEREPNNDILDFISHVPANNTLKDWKELCVPEPIQSPDTPEIRTEGRLPRAVSSNI